MSLVVITGGQSGVDEGATEGVWNYCTEQKIRNNAAKPLAQRECAVDWEVIMPKGYRRESPMPAWLKSLRKVHITCTESAQYEDRTNFVVNLADAVLLIEEPGKVTPGTKLTLGLARRESKQLWRFQNVTNRAVHRAESHAIAYWLRSLESILCVGKRQGGSIKLMVAGPRESKWPDGAELASIIAKEICEAYERDIHVQPQRS